MDTFPRSRALARVAGALATIGLTGVAVFQGALAGGAPYGHASWGGADPHLPTDLRVASAVSCVVLLGAALLVLRRAGFWGSSRVSSVSRWGTRVLVPILALSALGNFASQSRWENFLLGPVSVLLAILCALVAIGAGSGRNQRRRRARIVQSRPTLPGNAA
jgi:hypothetical protein